MVIAIGEVSAQATPTAEELYNKHARVLYGMAMRLADGPCAEDAFHDACVELWSTEAKRAEPCTVARMLQVTIAEVRKHCWAGGTTRVFERRLAALVSEIRVRAGHAHSVEFAPRPVGASDPGDRARG